MRLAYLRRQGCLVQANSGRLLLGFTLTLLVLCFAIKSTKLDLDLNNWIQKSSTIEAELNYISQSNGCDSSGSNSELIVQTPTSSNNNGKNGVLNVDAMMIHLEAMAIATHISIDLFDVTWTLKDICFRPTLPNIEGFDITILLDRMMPCAIKTPLDCFWEGSKLHGPHDIMTGPQTLGLKKWTELDPVTVIENLQSNRPHASIDYQSLLEWMNRVGIKHGYQRKPCLDPTDPICPDSAPNKLSKSIPNIGQHLTGGCYGVAENQMHWREEEIVGGSVKNKTGFISKANAIQSSIPLMSEQDLYDYWSKTLQTNDINNWSVEKAKMILDTWEKRFKEDLDHFTKSMLPSQSSQRIHSMSSKSMLEPIDADLLLDYTNFLLSFSLMTLTLCICFPKFKFNLPKQFNNNQLSKQLESTIDGSPEGKVVFIGRLCSIQLAIASSLLVGLTFLASLGFCSFMNWSFNLATTQILPPLALYYGFNQLNSVVNIYSQKFAKVPIKDLTTSCLMELYPIITTESKTYLIALLVATLIPVSATRALALQAITHILLATFVSIVLLPAIMTNFLLRQYRKHVPLDDEEEDYDDDSDNSCDEGSGEVTIAPKIKSKNSIQKFSFRSKSPVSFISSKIKSAKQTKSDNSIDIDKMFSRIQDDLKNIQVDSRNNTPTNFETKIDNLETSFNNLNEKPNQQQNTPTIDYNKHIQYAKSPLPDLILSAQTRSAISSDIETVICSKTIDCGASTISEASTIDIKDLEPQDIESGKIDSDIHKLKATSIEKDESILTLMIKNLILNKYIKVLIILIKLAFLIQLLPYAQQVKYGLQLKDIVSQGTEQYDSFLAQEKYFSIYNIFAVTKGNFDYPSKQKLLHDYYKTLSSVDGIVKDKNVNRFWLVAFRDWLLDLQRKFDIDKSKSHITNDGWTEDASEASKLAYKLLAQTGRVENPIDRSLITANRLVDANGIINQKAFYHYLTAWVSTDAFVYATTEANFKPEPKIMKEDLNDLRIEKARPLTYAQIPFLLKISQTEDSVKMISKIRSISRKFEQLNLPNFPTGIPFVFWDQFISLDSLMLAAVLVAIVSIFLAIFESSKEIKTAAIVTVPMILTLMELYCFMGILRIPFNIIVAYLIISSIGIMIAQSVHYVTVFTSIEDESKARIIQTIQKRIVMVMTSLVLLFLCSIVFLVSKVEFMINFSYLLLALFQSNLFNSIILTPVLLSWFGTNYKPIIDDISTGEKIDKFKKGKAKKSSKKSLSSSSKQRIAQESKSNNRGATKTRNKRSKSSVSKQILAYQRKVQSEQSLSTISEEP